MKVQSMVGVMWSRRGAAFQDSLVALATGATLMLVPAAARAADPGASGGKSAPVMFESIPGSSAKRIFLTPKAAERLGIEVDKVGEQPVVRKQMVSGLVIPPMEKQVQPKPAGGGLGTFGGFAKAAAAPAPRAKSAAAGEAWVLVTLSPGEWDRLAKDRPARVLPLATRDKLIKEVVALPTGMPPLEDVKRSMLTLYYAVPSKDHGLTLNDRMRVELQLAGSEEKQKVVPYGAVYYDAKGAPWVYVNTRPYVYERQRIGVDRVVGDLAVLTEGPPVGTPVVSVGAALLYGTEIFGK